MIEKTKELDRGTGSTMQQNALYWYNEYKQKLYEYQDWTTSQIHHMYKIWTK